MNLERLEAGLARAREGLLSARTPEGWWAGELSSSALSTATAVIALAQAGGPPGVIARGLAWLAAHTNPDGGWGDTPRSQSNISTSALCWAAFGAVPGADREYAGRVEKAEIWLRRKSGSVAGKPGAAAGLSPEDLARAIIARYGKDRTFSVPILTACALSGRLGAGTQAWERVLPLPFELAAFPHRWYAALRLPVVSYALPALIAIGYARHFHRPPRNPFVRALRNGVRARAFAKLASIQPSSGGFLEATPLTSFVVMSLAGSGLGEHPVVANGKEFLLKSQRADGSWPIDTNLSTWLTTLSINALFIRKSEPPLGLQGPDLVRVRDWLLKQQFPVEHPYTHAAPGAWAWTDLPGGVPDADDTAGAVLALATIRRVSEKPVPDQIAKAAQAGIEWLLDLQNRDGGIPTFCRGWGTLAFDRSAADLTAHAIRAWLAWATELPPPVRARVFGAVENALKFLQNSQREDGAWIPLWFGNERAPSEENPTYGTSRVVRALCDAAKQWPSGIGPLSRGVEWLLQAQTPEASWDGGVKTGSGSVEETALALEALAAVLHGPQLLPGVPLDRVRQAVASGTDWLLKRVESEEWTEPSPIGFYFAKLWYYEKLYPQVFTVASLSQVRHLCG